MKTIILFFLTIFALQAQDKPVMKNDTLYYQDQKIHINKPIRLGYGSSATKDFAFVYFGTGLTGMTKAPSHFNKSDLLVEKIKMKGNKYWITCKLLGMGPMLGNKIMFDLEGAVDFKEVVL
jgi:hypothetical protein